MNDEAVEQRLTRTVEELDETIRQIRTTIFALQEDSSRSLRGTALAIVDQLAPLLPVRPDVQLLGPLDTIADDAIIADVEAVLAGVVDQRREARSSRADPGTDPSRQAAPRPDSDRQRRLAWVRAPGVAAWQT